MKPPAVIDVLCVPAIEVHQRGQRLYTFAVDGKLVPRFAAVSRVRRGEDGAILGYQRPEVRSHIREIAQYLATDAPLLPNAVVIALDTRAHFSPGPAAGSLSYARSGMLHIPLSAPDSAERCGFIVDGQQRLAALRSAPVGEFAICVSAFITDDLATQTQQFILVNSTKPLPKGLLYELLPSTSGGLPSALQRRRLPAELVEQLNQRRDSALYGLVQTITNPRGVVNENALLRQCEQSLTDGRLHDYYDAEGQPQTEPMLRTLLAFFAALRHVFRDAWGLKPKQSRLLHGVGVIAMGFVMDMICARHRAVPVLREAHFVKELKLLVTHCHWTDGAWDFGGGQIVRWNALQNRDIQRLSHHLLMKYKQVCKQAPAPPCLPLLGAAP